MILTEKPQVAEKIGKAIGYSRQKNGVWTDASGRNCVVNAHGHLLELYEPEDYDPALRQWKAETLPIIPGSFRYKPIPGTYPLLKTIKNCLESYASDGLVIATDPEREGELIADEILSWCGYRMKGTERRFWTSEGLNSEIIRKYLAEARPLSEYRRYAAAGYGRQQSDWIVGMNFSRMLSIRSGTQLTFGRVQTAVLAAVYMRDRQIESFVPADYCEMSVSFGCYSLFLASSDGSTRHEPSSELLVSAQKKILAGSEAVVKTVRTERFEEKPPQLFDITELQKHCAQKYGLSAKETLDIVQELYEADCMSYPRTPSNVLGDDNVDLYRSVYSQLKGIYPQLAAGCREEKITAGNKRLFNTAKLVDHHALIPLAPLAAGAGDKQRLVYEAVADRFFSVIKDSRIYETVTVEADCSGFRLLGKGIKNIRSGWKTAVSPDEEDDDVQDQVFPESCTEGSKASVQGTETLQKKTRPKKHYTEATILALMKNPLGEEGETLHVLGSPATRADIIEKLFSRGYLERKNRCCLITGKGKFLIETVIKTDELRTFIGLKTTTVWEEMLEKDPSAFYRDIKAFVVRTVPLVTADKWEKPSLGTCPQCGKGVVCEGKKSWYCSLYKSGCSFTVWKEICGARISAAEMQAMLSGGKTRKKKMKSRAGKEFSASLMLADDAGVIKTVFAPEKKRA
jgi:DNA topoisomerase-3